MKVYPYWVDPQLGPKKILMHGTQLSTNFFFFLNFLLKNFADSKNDIWVGPNVSCGS